MQIKLFDRPDSSLVPANAQEAISIQNSLRDKISLQNNFKEVNIIAGVDCSFDIKGNLSRAVITLLRYSDLKPIESVMALQPTVFPYVPGLLAFREIPVILSALSMLKEKPDILMVDGQGIAHPRRMGIASHLGALINMPTLGVAKSRLTGKYIEPGLNKFDMSELADRSEKIGVVLRSKNNVKPLFISPGHFIDHPTTLDIVKHCLIKYRLPEPTRIADKLSKTKFEEAVLI